MDYAMISTKQEDDFDGSDSSNLGNYLNNNNDQGNQNRMQNTNGMSKAELRKSNKPIMEKRRRARINHCLNELKSLILEAMKKDPARHTKLEKADILEMTVKHLQSVQRQQLSLAIQTDPTVIHKFKTGFSDCADEVNRYIGQLDGIDQATRQRLTNHLNNCASGIEQIGTFSNFSSTFRTTPTASGFCNQLSASNSIFHSPQDVNNNNNGRISMGGVQLIPSRLPSGELALIMPNSNTMPSSFFMPSIHQSTAQQSLDFTNSFPRLSAFSKPSLTNNTTTTGINLNRPSATQTTGSGITVTTSPPLSPASSISSLGADDSIMHTSSDFPSKTPPNDHSLSDCYSTPPSTDSLKFFSRTGHLQQSHVSSTSESSSGKEDSFTRKRLRPDEFKIKLDEPKSKNMKYDDDKKNGNLSSDQNSSLEDGNDSMWRPW